MVQRASSFLTLVTPSLPWQDCSYFNSNAVPLKLSFQNVDPLGENIRVIFKVRTRREPGDDKGGRREGKSGSKGGRSSPRASLFLLLRATIFTCERLSGDGGNRLILHGPSRLRTECWQV